MQFCLHLLSVVISSPAPSTVDVDVFVTIVSVCSVAEITVLENISEVCSIITNHNLQASLLIFSSNIVKVGTCCHLSCKTVKNLVS